MISEVNGIRKMFTFFSFCIFHICFPVNEMRDEMRSSNGFVKCAVISFFFYCILKTLHLAQTRKRVAKTTLISTSFVNIRIYYLLLNSSAKDTNKTQKSALCFALSFFCAYFSKFCIIKCTKVLHVSYFIKISFVYCFLPHGTQMITKSEMLNADITKVTLPFLRIFYVYIPMLCISKIV